LRVCVICHASWFCRFSSRSSALVCLSIACLLSLFVFWFPPSSDWYRTSGFLYFFGRGEVLADASMKGVYVRIQSFSSSRSNSDSSTSKRYSLWHSSLVLLALDTSPSISRSSHSLDPFLTLCCIVPRPPQALYLYVFWSWCSALGVLLSACFFVFSCVTLMVFFQRAER
jgi:hypothetical protein